MGLEVLSCVCRTGADVDGEVTGEASRTQPKHRLPLPRLPLTRSYIHSPTHSRNAFRRGFKNPRTTCLLVRGRGGLGNVL